MRIRQPSSETTAPEGWSHRRFFIAGKDASPLPARLMAWFARIMSETIGREGVCPIKMAMRIALLTHQWPGARMGGIGSAVAQTASALACAGHDVHVFTLALPDDVRSSLASNFTIHEGADLATRVQQGIVSPELAAALQSGGDG